MFEIFASGKDSVSKYVAEFFISRYATSSEVHKGLREQRDCDNPSILRVISLSYSAYRTGSRIVWLKRVIADKH